MLLQGKAPDLKYLEMAARDIADVVVEGSKVVVEKSTVPVRAAESIATILRDTKKPGASFQVILTYSPSNKKIKYDKFKVQSLQRVAAN